MLIRERKMSAEAVSELLYLRSGLLGVSQISGDMETLLASADPRAGIGENAPRIRQRVCQAAAWLGVGADPARNERGEMNIGSAGSGVDVFMIPADEEYTDAEGALECLETAETAPRSHA